MIGYLSGTLLTATQNPLLLDVHGVGYAVHVTESLLGKITPNNTLSLFIHTHVREDTLDLYGFQTPEELYLFKLLLSVSGIGPRTALLVINHGVQQIRTAVANADTDFFTAIPRLGKKNAQKIIIELKSKLGSIQELDLQEEGTDSAAVIEALVSMGFAKAEIVKALKTVPDTQASLSEQIRQTLKILGGKS